jgi:hypothetical protein
VDEHLLEEMEQRVRSRPEVMKRRTQLVEHPFGTMKRWWDAGDFLMRGLEKVPAEFIAVCSCLYQATVSRQHCYGARTGLVWYTHGQTGLV